MAVVLTYAASVPVVKLGRLAGQYAKPRSSDLETRGEVTLPAYRGDAVNGFDFTAEARRHDPQRLVEVYHASAATLNLVRAFVTGGYADLRQVHTWNTDFVLGSEVGRKYEQMAAEIDRALNFMKAIGADPDEFHRVDFHSSHEALVLEYEHALTRIDSRTQLPYDVSSHFVWIGERTRQLDGAHVRLLSSIQNPIGVKLGPTTTADDAIALAAKLNPANEAGRLTFITRMGAGKIREHLPPLLEKVHAAGVEAAWVCDPMHGNTFEASSGYKTRRFDDVIEEVQGFFDVHRAVGTWPGRPARRAHRRRRDRVRRRWRGAARGRSRQPLRVGVRPAPEPGAVARAVLPRRRDAAQGLRVQRVNEIARVALGVDLGTSGVKVALLDESGAVRASASRGYPVASPHPGWAETDPALWERAAQQATAEVLASTPGVEVVAVGIDGQMHGTVLVDETGLATRPAVLWPDARASEVMDRWTGLPRKVRARLANPLTPGMPGPVLSWLAEHEPETVARSAAFVLPKDWVRSRLVSTPPCTDASDASASLLWDVQADGWSTEAAELTGVPLGLLPPVRSAESAAGGLDADAAATWGLPADIPVSVGCSDVAATLLGLDAESHRTVLTVGTGAQLVLPGITPRPTDEVRHHVYRDALGGWYAMGAIMNAGLALGRVVDLLDADWDDLYRVHDAREALPGFLPYFSGERLPKGVPAGGAGWFDVALGTTRADLLAAALEGVAFSIRRSLEVMPDSDDVIDVVGGGTRSPVFRQLLANVLGRPLCPREQRDATVLGAARLGWRAAGEKPATEARAGQVLVEPRAIEQIEERYARFLRHTDGAGI